LSYFWNFSAIEKLRSLLLCVFFLASLIVIIGVFTGNESFWSLIPILALSVHLYRKLFIEYRQLRNNKNLAPKVVLNDNDLFYSKGKSDYQVTLKYDEIINIKSNSILGISRVVITLTGARKLVVWNISKSSDIVSYINKKYNKRNHLE
jgi:hypothetical protein